MQDETKTAILDMATVTPIVLAIVIVVIAYLVR
jgi:hypothetical protein